MVVWHHAAYDEKTNSCIMQLVYTSEHKAKLPHEGAVKQFEMILKLLKIKQKN